LTIFGVGLQAGCCRRLKVPTIAARKDGVEGPYDMRVTSAESGTWRVGIASQPAARLRWDLKLTDALSVVGTVRMLDGITPQVAV